MFDTPELAAKYFRYCIENEVMKRVGGDDVVLDPEEDFRVVKDKSANYRYYEHTEKGLFWDIDRYDETIDIWHGPIGKRGEQVIEEFEWANPAKEAYKEYCAEREDAIRVKAIQVSSAPKLNLLDLYTYHLKDYKRAIAYAGSFQAHDPNTRFYRLKALAFATSKSGDDAATAKLYNELNEVVGNDKKLQAILAEDLS